MEGYYTDLVKSCSKSTFCTLTKYSAVACYFVCLPHNMSEDNSEAYSMYFFMASERHLICQSLYFLLTLFFNLQIFRMGERNTSMRTKSSEVVFCFKQHTHTLKRNCEHMLFSGNKTPADSSEHKNIPNDVSVRFSHFKSAVLFKVRVHDISWWLLHFL